MRIGILTGEEFAFGTYGGFGFVARKTANLLRALGHDICIIDCSHFNANSTDTHQIDGIPVYFLIDTKVRLGPLEELRIAKRFLKRISRDRIIGISAYVCGKWIYYFKKASRESKTLLWFQDVRTDEDWKRIFSIPLYRSITTDKYLPISLLHEKYRRFLRQKGIKQADGLISQAHLMNNKIKKLYNIENVTLVPNPISIPSEGTLKKQRKPLVVYLGRLDLIKRPWIFAEIAKRLPEIEFLVLGVSHFPTIMNPIMEKYKRIKNLKFLGLTVGEQKKEILRKAWLLVNTSIYESLPVSFLEALSYKMAILSCQNPDDITSNYGYYTGKPFEYGRHEISKFTKGLEYLLSDDLWRKKGEHGYQFVRRFAEEKRIANKLETILNRL